MYQKPAATTTISGIKATIAAARKINSKSESTKITAKATAAAITVETTITIPNVSKVATTGATLTTAE